MQTLYKATIDFIEDTLIQIAENGGASVPDDSLKIEIALSEFGEEWTGIRVCKLPTAAAKRFISGKSEVDLKIELVSKQAIEYTPDALVAYSVYLEQLASELTKRFKKGERPELENGAILKRINVLSQASNQFTDGNFSRYSLTVSFIYSNLTL